MPEMQPPSPMLRCRSLVQHGSDDVPDPKSLQEQWQRFLERKDAGNIVVTVLKMLGDTLQAEQGKDLLTAQQRAQARRTAQDLVQTLTGRFAPAHAFVCRCFWGSCALCTAKKVQEHVHISAQADRVVEKCLEKGEVGEVVCCGTVCGPSAGGRACAVREWGTEWWSSPASGPERQCRSRVRKQRRPTCEQHARPQCTGCVVAGWGARHCSGFSMRIAPFGGRGEGVSYHCHRWDVPPGFIEADSHSHSHCDCDCHWHRHRMVTFIVTPVDL